MRGASGPTVVKLGGSYAFSPFLKNWIDAVKDCAGCVVLVPGGGPFADAVRATQPRMGFDDMAAHHMAMLGMEQFGYALASFHRRLAVADSMEDLQRVLSDGNVPIWLPARMAMQAADIPQSWEVT